jgi:hypothetical protein
LVRNDALRHDYGTRGRLRALEFSWNSSAAQLRHHFDTLL